MQQAGETRAFCSVSENLVVVEMPKAHLYISLFVEIGGRKVTRKVAAQVPLRLGEL